MTTERVANALWVIIYEHLNEECFAPVDVIATRFCHHSFYCYIRIVLLTVYISVQI